MKKIMERIKKLLDLAKDKCNRHVAEAAAQKAQQLITEHNLRVEMFDEDSKREDPHWVGFLLKNSSPQVWEVNLACELSRHNYGACCIFREGVKFCGSQRDYDVVKWLFQWICKQIHDLCTQEIENERLEDTFKSRNSYRQGIVETITVRLNRAKEEAERAAKIEAMVAELDGKYALVPVDTASQNLQDYLRRVLDIALRGASSWGARSEVNDQNAFSAGMRDGHKVDLNAGNLNG